MFSTLFTVALLVAPAIQGVYAGFAINSPALVQCKSSRISWDTDSSKGPYNLIVVKASDPCGDAVAEVGDFSAGFVDWKTTVKAGTIVQLSIVDVNDQEAWSKNITIGANTDASCLSTGVSSTTPTTTASSTTPTDSDSADDTSSTAIAAPIGAANAGTIPGTSGAITARQATTPLLALAGLVAVFTLL